MTALPKPHPAPKGNRPASVRMNRILGLLKDGDFPNCQRLAETLEVSAKTIQRDIDCMRDQMRLPISYDPQEHGYYLTEDVHALPMPQITQGELLALLVAHKTIEQYRGTPYYDQLKTAFDKLLAPLKEMSGYAPSAHIVSFKINAPAAHELDVFDRLGRAIDDQIEVAFDYRKPGETAPAPRRVQPFHLAHRESRWYLIGHDLDREAMRTFAVARITDVELSARWFERPDHFCVDRYFATALGVMTGTENHHVRIRFSAFAADHVRDRYWHESQDFIPQPDGRLDLTLQLADLIEVERLILQWGGHAEALEPAELRARLAAAGEKLGALHLAS